MAEVRPPDSGNVGAAFLHAVEVGSRAGKAEMRVGAAAAGSLYVPTGEPHLPLGQRRRVDPFLAAGTSTIRIGFAQGKVDEFGEWVGEFFLLEGEDPDGALQGVAQKGGWDFSAVNVREYISGRGRGPKNIKPRIETRQAIERELQSKGGEVIQLAYSFADGPQRDRFLGFVQKKLGQDFPFEVRQAGSTTVEIGAKGITKAASISYLSKASRFGSVLDQAGYQPRQGQLIDAREQLKVVVADADGTLLPKPVSGRPYSESGLNASAARDSILNYLRAGGFLVINSGNDAVRIAERIRAGIPEGEMHLLHNVAVGVNGGHALYVFDDEGRLKEVEGYRRDVSSTLGEGSRDVEMLYLGDDVRAPTPGHPEKAGNDWDAYEIVGFDCSIAVPDPKKPVPEEAKIHLQHVLPGLEGATRFVFDAILSQAESATLGFDQKGVDAIYDQASKMMRG